MSSFAPVVTSDLIEAVSQWCNDDWPAGNNIGTWDVSSLTSFAKVFEFVKGCSKSLVGVKNWDMSQAKSTWVSFLLNAL